jgi:hypothetical protein
MMLRSAGGSNAGLPLGYGPYCLPRRIGSNEAGNLPAAGLAPHNKRKRQKHRNWSPVFSQRPPSAREVCGSQAIGLQ